MTEDPGYIPKLGSRNQQRTVISQLFDLWKFDEENFCIYCMVRKPLRSKHCRRCNRCVAKHDHHCPWIENCVGANNLRHFVLYVVSLELGIILFVQLSIYYTFTLVLDFWVMLQLVWVTMLCAVQLVQVSRNQTTYENMKGHHVEKTYPSTQAFAAALAAGASSLDAAGLSSAGRGPSPAATATAAAAGGGSGAAGTSSGGAHRHGGSRRNCFQQWTVLLGINTFFATARGGFGEGPRVARPRNPFSRGIVTNCQIT
ncbi:hypothetical protein ASPZODRAFT_147975 [Penicilliopsis zonata CBS 506.65]|uniref:Palmitoyltransferase n=1 Tax=Penicilliopsis zonata CBS 506.65 TaxID=1073090 RepID=A0A1L9STR1_9EURO|nr:hypothetical protein ASPZODRAFT_147975 [Penicilliopsis zonata CBS 506.65]OJJ50463.1 hypothetical protein ASPZODRAFT_147975 [Penicilliopsis zonata CBS 506.65]